MVFFCYPDTLQRIHCNKMFSMHWLARTELLIGEKNVERLRNSHVLVAGLGGVGRMLPSSCAVPALASCPLWMEIPSI